MIIVCVCCATLLKIIQEYALKKKSTVLAKFVSQRKTTLTVHRSCSNKNINDSIRIGSIRTLLKDEHVAKWPKWCCLSSCSLPSVFFPCTSSSSGSTSPRAHPKTTTSTGTRSESSVSWRILTRISRITVSIIKDFAWIGVWTLHNCLYISIPAFDYYQTQTCFDYFEFSTLMNKDLILTSHIVYDIMCYYYAWDKVRTLLKRTMSNTCM